MEGGSARDILRKFAKECETPLEKLKQVAGAMVEDMHAGLRSEGGGKMKMFMSRIENLPTGDEEGVFYALDFGERNFRVLRVKLGGDVEGGVQTEYVENPIPRHLKVGTSIALFDYIASCVSNFIAKEGEGYEKRKVLGFTFPFPVTKLSINSAKLIRWTKGFDVKDLVDKDVVEELTKAMDRVGLDIHVSALINDSVGILAGGRFFNNDVVIGVILATGTNAAYVERVDAIPKLVKPKSGLQEMVINTEWAFFDSTHLPVTEYDRQVDAESTYPGTHTYEKLTASRYLGDIVRKVLCTMAKEASLFGDTIPPKLEKRFILTTPEMSFMYNDDSKDLDVVGEKLEDIFDILDHSLETRKIVFEVCHIVVTRAARLIAAGFLAILKKMGRDTLKKGNGKKTVIAIDGPLYEHFTAYNDCMKNTLRELLGQEVYGNIVMEHFHDGGGIGAAILAASHSTP